MIRVVRCLLLTVVLGSTQACADQDTRYYKHRIDVATMSEMAKRYGAPHTTEVLGKNKQVWTYYERGSGTAGYSGLARGGYCHAYVLTFDEHDVLREWKELECEN